MCFVLLQERFARKDIQNLLRISSSPEILLDTLYTQNVIKIEVESKNNYNAGKLSLIMLSKIILSPVFPQLPTSAVISTVDQRFTPQIRDSHHRSEIHSTYQRFTPQIRDPLHRIP